MNATHRQSGPPSITDFSADFGNHGKSFGAFAGYGHAFGWLYGGVELEADAGSTGWFHVKDPGGRDFSVQAQGDYGAALRLGYVTREGAVIYLRGGRVRGRFNTKYVKGGNSDAWIDREDTIDGTRYGVGVATPLGEATFLRFDYTTTRYAGMDFTTTQAQADDVGLVHHQHLFRIGIGMRF
jgi:phage-related tail fiber protein